MSVQRRQLGRCQAGRDLGAQVGNLEERQADSTDPRTPGYERPSGITWA